MNPSTPINPCPQRRVASSTQSRIRSFYERNPDEVLSFTDVMVKFGLTKDQAYIALRELEHLTDLSVVRTEKYYQAGPRLRAY